MLPSSQQHATRVLGTNIFSIISNNGKCKSRTGQWACLLFGLLMKGTVRSPTTCFVFCAIIFDVILCQSFASVKMSFRAEDVVFYLVGRNKQGESNAKKYLSYFWSSGQIIPKRPLTPPFPTNGWVSSHNTQYTAPTHHTRHSTCLYYYLRVSNVSFPTNDFLHVSKLVRVATAFDIRRRFDGGGDPPNKNKKTTFSLHTGAAPSSEKM